MVVVHLLVYTVEHIVACMMMTHVIMIELLLHHWWVKMNQYLAPVFPWGSDYNQNLVAVMPKLKVSVLQQTPLI